MDNMTILCKDCQQRKGNSWWDGLVSLWQEEQANGRPPSVEELEKIESEKRHLMGNPGSGSLPALKSKPVWEIQQEKINDLFSLINRLDQKINAIQAAHAKLEARLSTLASRSGPGRRPDEISAKTLAFLKAHPGLKFNSGTVAANIQSDSKTVSSRLKTLFGRGLVHAEKVSEMSAMYWCDKEEKGEEGV